MRAGRLHDTVQGHFRVPVFDAWRRVRQHGVGTATVTTRDDEAATTYFFDTRSVHGVVLAVVVPGVAKSAELAALGPEAPARSRFGRSWRDDLGRVPKMDEAAEQHLGFSAADVDRVVEQLAEPLELTSGQRVPVRAGIGVARQVNGTATADGLVARADAAMHEATGRGDGWSVLASTAAATEPSDVGEREIRS